MPDPKDQQITQLTLDLARARSDFDFLLRARDHYARRATFFERSSKGWKEATNDWLASYSTLKKEKSDLEDLLTRAHRAVLFHRAMTILLLLLFFLFHFVL